MICPKCGKGVDENSSFCKFCGHQFERKTSGYGGAGGELGAQEQINDKKTDDSATKRIEDKAILIFVGGIVALFLVVYVGDSIYDSNYIEPIREKARQERIETGIEFGPSITSCSGESLRRVDSNADVVPVATDANAAEKLINAISAEDDNGIKELVYKGSVFVLEPGTCVRVLDYGFFNSEIRILHGIHENRRAFIFSNFLE